MGISATGPANTGTPVTASTSDDTPTPLWTDPDGPRNVLVEAWVAGRETGFTRTTTITNHIVVSTFSDPEGSWVATAVVGGGASLQASINGSDQLVIEVVGNPGENINWTGKVVVRAQ